MRISRHGLSPLTKPLLYAAKSRIEFENICDLSWAEAVVAPQRAVYGVNDWLAPADHILFLYKSLAPLGSFSHVGMPFIIIQQFPSQLLKLSATGRLPGLGIDAPYGPTTGIPGTMVGDIFKFRLLLRRRGLG